MFVVFPLRIAIREELALWNQMKQPIDPPSEVRVKKSEEVKQDIQVKQPIFSCPLDTLGAPCMLISKGLCEFCLFASLI